jgi:hypothetical protein
MKEEKLLFKIIEMSEKSDNNEIKTIIKFMLDFQVQTLKRVSNLQTKTIEMLEQVTSQMVELHDVKKQIKELESLRDETEVEI